MDVARYLGLSEDELMAMIEKVVDYHDKTTTRKQRMSKMITDPDFPFQEV